MRSGGFLCINSQSKYRYCGKIEGGNDEAAESMIVEIMVKLGFLPEDTKVKQV